MQINGNIRIPGDKSIAHRALIIASFCNGVSILKNIPKSLDIKSTIHCLQQCGIKIEVTGIVKVNGGAWKRPSSALNCGNSGTTMRLMGGALAAKNIRATLIGDSSLNQRPMDRIIEPLSKMGVEIISKNKKAPLQLNKIELNQIKYNITVPSAQVKSCLILASLGVKKLCEISENYKTRDHIELLIESLSGKKIVNKNNKIIVNKDIIDNISGFTYNIPGDISSASFLIGLAVLCDNSKLIINNILLNKHRIGFINTLIKMGANIKITKTREELGEKIGTIIVLGGETLRPCIPSTDDTVDMIDEIPILSLVCAYTNGQSILSGLGELVIKESNRFEGIINILLNMGVNVEPKKESIIINGEKRLYNTNKLGNNKDHRLAMMICIAQLLSNQQPEFSPCIDVSFPLFEKSIKEIINE